ncbi:MAG: ABC transporter substrate-binding protein [Dehalococcoidia bacterium]|nr:ABC transporter substrate-binding protein [Dehalococcoidia bacterium]
MKLKGKWIAPVIGVLALALVASACTPAATPTATPIPKVPASTAVPAAAPTTPPAAATSAPAPAATSVPTKPPAPAATSAPTTAAAKPAAGLTLVRVGGLPGSVADSGFHIGIAKGYFKDQGLDVQVTPFQSATFMIAPLASGDLEIGGGTISAALFNAIERGVPMKLVGTKGSNIEGYDFSWMAVRKDLIDSGQIKTPADLKGRKVAVTALAGGGEAIAANLLKQGGLTIKDVDLLGLATPDMLTGFANKGIDAAVQMESALTATVEQGLAVRWQGSHTIYGGQYQAAELIASEQFMKNTDVARRFMVAYLKSLRDYNDAFVKKVNRADIVAIIAKATNMDPALFDKMGMPYLDPDGKMDVNSMKMDLDYFKQMGYYTGKLELQPQIDTQFIDYALQQLGPYKK